MPFGLKSAVANFNRPADLAVVALRRLCAILSWHCFDDTGFLQLAVEEDWAQLSAASMLNQLFEGLGLPNAAKKREVPSPSITHLGVHLDLQEVPHDQVRVKAKPGRIDDIQAQIESILTDGAISPEELASLRGHLAFLSSTSFDRMARAGVHLLELQGTTTSAPWHLTELALKSISYVLKNLGPRAIPLQVSDNLPYILYSDAAWDNTLQRVGAVLCHRGQVLHAAWCDIPADFVASLKPRVTQILPAEAVAVLLATWWFSSHLQSCRVIAFMDSTGAASAMATGASHTWDLAYLALLWHQLAAHYSISVWVEHVQSVDKPADEPSRSSTLFGRPALHKPWPAWLRVSFPFSVPLGGEWLAPPCDCSQ
eukprot:6488716-Amphidinium_carterae.1